MEKFMIRIPMTGESALFNTRVVAQTWAAFIMGRFHLRVQVQELK